VPELTSSDQTPVAARRLGLVEFFQAAARAQPSIDRSPSPPPRRAQHHVVYYDKSPERQLHGEYDFSGLARERDAPFRRPEAIVFRTCRACRPARPLAPSGQVGVGVAAPVEETASPAPLAFAHTQFTIVSRRKLDDNRDVIHVASTVGLIEKSSVVGSVGRSHYHSKAQRCHFGLEFVNVCAFHFLTYVQLVCLVVVCFVGIQGESKSVPQRKT